MQYFKSVRTQLPAFFQAFPSLHDALIKQWSMREVHWGRNDLTISLNCSYSLTKVKQLIFKCCTAEPNIDLSQCTWIADEIYVQDGGYILNILCTDHAGDCREVSIRFTELDIVV